ncbi:hypothetical protein [Pseudomonas viridiflava]|uniref:hypothetical protein n=1 Tax=Pseudomonas viridiflava TaxID=33069 RepID=UPI0013CE7583|nr:hypothetical protein [Pseudomonas viridiflava]
MIGSDLKVAQRQKDAWRAKNLLKPHIKLLNYMIFMNLSHNYPMHHEGDGEAAGKRRGWLANIYGSFEAFGCHIY